jgi:hypothetical protein
VTTVKVGDRVGVGAQISACLDCTQCKEGNETYCKKQQDTYNSFYPDGTLAMGGYSSHIRALEHFTFPIPDALESELAAPMLCAGLTAYSPLVRNGTGPGKKVGIIGMYVIPTSEPGINKEEVDEANAPPAAASATSASSSPRRSAPKSGPSREAPLSAPTRWPWAPTASSPPRKPGGTRRTR